MTEGPTDTRWLGCAAAFLLEAVLFAAILLGSTLGNCGAGGCPHRSLFFLEDIAVSVPIALLFGLLVWAAAAALLRLLRPYLPFPIAEIVLIILMLAALFLTVETGGALLLRIMP